MMSMHSWGTESMHTSFVGHGVCERGLSRHRPDKLCRAHKMVTRPRRRPMVLVFDKGCLRVYNMWQV